MRYIKQYGKQRTGTNYIRAEIHRHYDVKVLCNILGWKHGWIEPWGIWLDNHIREGSVPLKIESQGDLYDIPIREMQTAIAENNVGVVICARNPMAWIAGRFEHLERLSGQYLLDISHSEIVEREVLDYNNKYREWIKLKSTLPVFIVNHEAVVRNWLKVITKIGEYFGLGSPRSTNSIEASVDAARDGDSKISKKVFRRESYLRDEYMERIPEDVKEMVARNIDWGVMSDLGYSPDTRYENWKDTAQ